MKIEIEEGTKRNKRGSLKNCFLIDILLLDNKRPL